MQRKFVLAFFMFFMISGSVLSACGKKNVEKQEALNSQELSVVTMTEETTEEKVDTEEKETKNKEEKDKKNNKKKDNKEVEDTTKSDEKKDLTDMSETQNGTTEKNKDDSWLEEISIKEAMKRLNDREKRILEMRFFSGRTQMEIANEIGISQAQVSRLEKNALGHMKKYL